MAAKTQRSQDAGHSARMMPGLGRERSDKGGQHSEESSRYAVKATEKN